MSFLCSIWEAVILSVTPSYIAQLEESNPKLHKKVLQYKEHIDTPLGAILTLNTISHTVGAAGVGAMVTSLYGEEYLGVASAVMTLAILLLSEILPKSFGAKYWKTFIPFTVSSLKILIFILKPFLYISDWIMGWFSSKNDSSTIREEIRALAKIGKEENVIDDNKYRIITNILHLHEVKTKDVMTPRTVVHSVAPGMTIKEFDHFLTQTPFSRFPIVDEKKQLFLGYIHKSSSYKATDTDKVEKFAHPMQSFYSEAKLETVLSSMLDEQTHMGLVIDQSGTWVGIITLEDIIETILGKEIVDETDIVPDMRLYAKMKWKKKQEKKA
ncbi:MAG: CNNM domain-containing protein [Lactobacillus sp.]|nr:CNNM domain-containing protein [Lactobacillus sp.]